MRTPSLRRYQRGRRDIHRRHTGNSPTTERHRQRQPSPSVRRGVVSSGERPFSVGVALATTRTGVYKERIKFKYIKYIVPTDEGLNSNQQVNIPLWLNRRVPDEERRKPKMASNTENIGAVLASIGFKPEQVSEAITKMASVEAGQRQDNANTRAKTTIGGIVVITDKKGNVTGERKIMRSVGQTADGATLNMPVLVILAEAKQATGIDWTAEYNAYIAQRGEDASPIGVRTFISYAKAYSPTATTAKAQAQANRAEAKAKAEQAKAEKAKAKAK